MAPGGLSERSGAPLPAADGHGGRNAPGFLFFVSLIRAMTKTTVSFLAIWLLVFLAYSGLRAHTFHAPLVHDDGLFLSGAQAWAGGELPYRDFWDHKPPGVFFFHSLPLRLFPFSLPAVKWHQILWLSGSAALLFTFCRRRFGWLPSLLAFGLYVFYTSTPVTIQSGGLTEECALFFVVLCFWLILRVRGTWGWNCFFAGLALGTAVEFRQTYVFTTAFLLGALLHNAHQRGKKLKEVPGSLAAMGLGLVLPEIFISIYFLAHGAWWDYFEASYLFNLYYIGPGRTYKPLEEILSLQWRFITSTGPYLYAPLLALSTCYWVPKGLRWMTWPLILAFLGDLVAISLSGEFYYHYYVQASVSMCLLLALFFEGFIRGLRSAWGAGLSSPRLWGTGFWGRGIYGLALLAATVLPLISGLERYRSEVHKIMENQRTGEGPYQMQRGVADAVRAMTTPEDRILLIGREPNSVYLLSHRYPGNRYYHYSPLWKKKLAAAAKPRHYQAFLSDLDIDQPALLLIDQKTLSLESYEEDTGDEKSRLRNQFLDRVNAFLADHYTPLENVAPFAPEDRWFWYDTRLRILVRKDLVEAVRKRLSVS